MAAIQRKRVYGPFTGGLNDKLSPIMIDQSEGAELTNFQVNDRGILEKYKGYQKDHSPFPDDTDSFIRFMLNYKKGSTVDILLMAARDDGNTNASYKVDFKKTAGDGTSAYIGHTAGTSASFTNGSTAVTGVGTTWSSHLKAGDKIKATSHADGVYGEIQSVNSNTSITLTANYSGATAANVAYIARIILHKDFIPRGIVFNNKAIITNGSERPMSFDNESLNKLTDTDAPAAYYVEAHKSRVFMAGTAANPSRVFWSAVNDEATWDAASYEDVFPQDNGVIISIKSFGDSLIVLKNNGRVYQIVGNFDESAEGEPDFIRKVDVIENVGTISEKSPVVHNNFLYFMTSTGIYRLDQRLYMEKVSYGADTFVAGLNFALGPSSNKSYEWDTVAHWNAGTHSGTVARDGSIQPYFDHITVSDLTTSGDATSGGCGYSCDIDSSANVHIAYVNSNGNVVYKKWTASTNTIDTTTTISSATTATGAVIRLRSDGEIGIAYTLSTGGIYYKQTTSSVFGAEEAIEASSTLHRVFDILFLPSAGEVRVLGYEVPNYSLRFFMRNAGVWNFSRIYPGSTVENIIHASFNYDGDSSDADMANGRIRGTAIIKTTASSNYQIRDFSGKTTSIDGVVWTTNVLFTYATTTSHNIKDRAWAAEGSYHSWFTNELGTIVTTTVGTVAASANASYGTVPVTVQGGTPTAPWMSHYTVNSVETIKEDSNAITNASSGTTSVTGYGIREMGTNVRINSGVYASVAPSSSPGSLLVRRFVRTASYTTDEKSDSTLTSWGTYSIVETTNGATVAHTVALSAAPGPSSYTAITNGQVVSLDPTKIYLKGKINFTLNSFSAPYVESIIIQYVGAGIDAKQPVGISFGTELYYAVSKVVDTANAHVIVQDTEDKLLKLSYSVSIFERFKDKLYAGKSTNGDLLILKQGYNFGAVSSAYTADFQSKEDFLDAIELEKDIYKFYVLYEVKPAGTFDFSYRTDSFATNGGTSWTSTTVAQTSAGIAEVKVGKKCRSIQFRVENDNADEQVGIIAVVLIYGLLNIR